MEQHSIRPESIWLPSWLHWYSSKILSFTLFYFASFSHQYPFLYLRKQNCAQVEKKHSALHFALHIHNFLKFLFDFRRRMCGTADKGSDRITDVSRHMCSKHGTSIQTTTDQTDLATNILSVLTVKECNTRPNDFLEWKKLKESIFNLQKYFVINPRRCYWLEQRSSDAE